MGLAGAVRSEHEVDLVLMAVPGDTIQRYAQVLTLAPPIRAVLWQLSIGTLHILERHDERILSFQGPQLRNENGKQRSLKPQLPRLVRL